jgi:hypothetical protein
MDVRLEQFRLEAAKLGGARRGRKFPKELISLGAAYASSRRAEGIAWQSIAQELDVTVPTLQRWLERAPDVTPAFHRVALVESRSSERFTAVLPGGLRIEGLSLDAVVSLARSLS